MTVAPDGEQRLQRSVLVQVHALPLYVPSHPSLQQPLSSCLDTVGTHHDDSDRERHPSLVHRQVSGRRLDAGLSVFAEVYWQYPVSVVTDLNDCAFCVVQQIEVPPDGTRVATPGRSRYRKPARKGMFTHARHAVALRLQSQKRPPIKKQAAATNSKATEHSEATENLKATANSNATTTANSRRDAGATRLATARVGIAGWVCLCGGGSSCPGW
jgi:hypothetical protein